MASGYCAKCQMPLIEGHWSMIQRKKYCESCANELDQVTARAKENDTLKKDFFRYLLSLFPSLSDVPEHWYNQIESMLKKKWTIKNIQNTIVYCGQQGKVITEENWGQLVYIYYTEAVQWVEHLRAIQKNNEQVDLTPRTIISTFQGTTYRDMPEYNIKDL